MYEDTLLNSINLLTLLEIEEIGTLIQENKNILEKKKNDHEKLLKMIKDIPNVVDIAEPCIICTNPLIGKVSFGVISYSCACKVIRTIHTKCWLSQEGSVPKCVCCGTCVSLVVPTLVGSSITKKIFCRNTV